MSRKKIKVRTETKSAFITMNSSEDSEIFMNKFQEYAKANETTLSFSIYVAKQDRISGNENLNLNKFKENKNARPMAEVKNRHEKLNKKMDAIVDNKQVPDNKNSSHEIDPTEKIEDLAGISTIGEILEIFEEKTEKDDPNKIIFSKLKVMGKIHTEQDFVHHIKNYLRCIFKKEYEPKKIVVHFDKKIAYVTLDFSEDSILFINSFQEFSKKHKTLLTFSSYQYKAEEISTPKKIMKTENQIQGQEAIHKTSIQVLPVMPVMPLMHLIPTLPMMPFIARENQINKFNLNDDNSVREYLYNFAHNIFPEYASKITTNLMEKDSSTRLKLIISQPEELTRIIHKIKDKL